MRRLSTEDIETLRQRMGGLRERTLLSGTEQRTVEIAGRLDAASARALAPAELSLREDAGGAEVGMLAFRMSGLAPDGVPWLGMDYGEVLFRLGVSWRGEPAWFVVRCALDRGAVAAAAAALMRYPVERVRAVEIDPGPVEWRLSVRDRRGETLVATLVPDSQSSEPPAEVRPVLVSATGKLHRIPWAETPAPRHLRASVTVLPGPLEQAALGAHAHWTTAVIHEGRLHRCGLAGPA